jgi:hypothetical protein
VLLERAQSDDGGANLVEMAFMMPVALVMLTGFLVVAVFLNNQLELENATGIAGEYLSLNRGTGAAADPCNLFVAAFKQVSPSLYLTPTYAITFSGNISNPYTGVSCKAASTYMTQSATALITVTYPCSLAIYGVNLVPGCTLKYQVTEIIQ